jgi:hypothetical protein
MSKCVFKIRYRNNESVYLKGMGQQYGLILKNTIVCGGISDESNPDYVMAGIYCRRLKKDGYL